MPGLPFSPSNLPLGHFLNNEFVPGPKNAKTFSVYNPANEKLVSDAVPIAGEDVVDQAVAFAEQGFQSWRKLPAAERQRIIYKLADLIEENADELGSLNRITHGGPRIGFSKAEVMRCAETFRYYAGWADKIQGESSPQDDGFLKIVRYEPFGVTAGITPWNGPLVILGAKAAPALAAGNAIIMKPSEKTPFSSLAFGALAKEAGLPPGVFQVLTGDGSTGALLARHMKIRKISFTGSVPVGKKIQQMAAETNLKRVTLELGGKSPAVVFKDANLDVAVPWLERAITSNSGQVCFAASRVYVQDEIYDEFVARYKEAIENKAKSMGDPEDDKTELGPLVDRAQFDRVTGFIERAQKNSQGKLLTGGGACSGSGFYVKPTVFTDVDPSSEIHRDEVFGPVSVIRRFKTEEEVLKIANDSEYGLMAGVFTQDINRALRVASEFDSGMVGINCVSLMFLSCPFGGSKQSGIGRESGVHALRSFTESKTLMVNLTYGSPDE